MLHFCFSVNEDFSIKIEKEKTKAQERYASLEAEKVEILDEVQQWQKKHEEKNQEVQQLDEVQAQKEKNFQEKRELWETTLEETKEKFGEEKKELELTYEKKIAEKVQELRALESNSLFFWIFRLCLLCQNLDKLFFFVSNFMVKMC
jgi:hypothetical protein